jgi:hypothetical protein
VKILVACEYSGRVRDAFIARGHVAMSCDLLETESPGPHYRGDIRDLITGTAAHYWDALIAHPPCTYLCGSGMHWTTRGLRDPQLTEDALAFVRLLLNAEIYRIAVENPIGAISTRIRKQDQVIQPYDFGDDASKRTALWLKNLPPLVPTKYVEPRIVIDPKTGKHAKRWANQTDSGQNRLPPSDDRWKVRSETYRGIADAMADQWGRLLPAA